MDKKLKFAFFGGEPLAVPILESLYEAGIVPSLVIANPDKPQGRNLIIAPPPAKVWAEAHSVPIFQPASLKNEEAMRKLKEKDWDFFLVVAYGQIIPPQILALPRLGVLNVHPSLLPKYRGPSPIVSAILNGDAETGVTLIKLDEEMDHGPILAQEKIKLAGNELVEDLEKSLAELAGDMLVKWFSAGPDSLSGAEQDHARATYVNKISKSDGEIDPEGDALANWRKFRAYHSSPRVFFFKNGKRIIITEAVLENGKFVIKKVLPEGKKEVSWAVWSANQ